MDVYFLVLPGVHLLDMSGPVQAIHESNELHGHCFNLHFVGLDHQVSSWQGLALTQLDPLPERVSANSLVVVCGMKLAQDYRRVAADDRLQQWLQRAHKDGALLAGICTGAFVLGEAGLLDGRRCTTHHRLLDQLRTNFPQARVIPERIFVEDGRLFTSAGVTAGIDLTLHLIARLRGAREAVDTARELVVFARRMADDPQISLHFQSRNHVSPLIHEVQDTLSRDLCKPITVARLAEQYRVSPRHLQRLFRASTGVSIKSYLTDLRLARATDLLARSDASVELVAERSGFQSTRAFRDAWLKKFGRAPTAMRDELRQLSDPDSEAPDSLPAAGH